MKSAQVKRVLQAAAALPPEKARRVVSALAAKAAPKPSAEERIRKLEATAAAAMEEAMMIRMEQWIEQKAPTP